MTEPLVTDRPDFTEACSTVGRRVAQEIETGYTSSCTTTTKPTVRFCEPTTPPKSCCDTG